MKQTVVVCMEPSKRLSELCGFSYLIERRFTIKELLDKGIVDKVDVVAMIAGKTICKSIPATK